MSSSAACCTTVWRSTSGIIENTIAPKSAAPAAPPVERDSETVAVAASSYSPLAPHPYMQKTKTLDFCIVLDGEAVLSSTRRKCPSRRAISSFSVAPATRGAIDRANQRELRSARTMRKLDVRLRGCITSLLAFNGSA
jgi:hypothetical protein